MVARVKAELRTSGDEPRARGIGDDVGGQGEAC
jgi:hypothetical protein